MLWTVWEARQFGAPLCLNHNKITSHFIFCAQLSSRYVAWRTGHESRQCLYLLPIVKVRVKHLSPSFAKVIKCLFLVVSWTTGTRCFFFWIKHTGSIALGQLARDFFPFLLNKTYRVYCLSATGTRCFFFFWIRHTGSIALVQLARDVFFFFWIRYTGSIALVQLALDFSFLSE